MNTMTNADLEREVLVLRADRDRLQARVAALDSDNLALRAAHAELQANVRAICHGDRLTTVRRHLDPSLLADIQDSLLHEREH